VDLNISQYTAFGKINLLPASSTLYAKFGVGFYTSSATASVDYVSITADSTDFGFTGGMGYQFFGMARTGGFAEVMYHSIMSEGATTIYVDFRAGVKILFL
jgi:hypothetical protein